MFSSVRVRLTIWYTVVMTCVLLVLAIATYLIVLNNAIRRTDSAIVEQADSFLKTVDAEANGQTGVEVLLESVTVAISEHRFRDTLFIVLDQSGNIVASSQEPERPEEHSAALESLHGSLHSLTGGKYPFDTTRSGRRAYRRYFRPFSAAQKLCTLVVLQSLHPQQEFLETLIGTFALVIPLAILLASSGGYFLARRSLAPVTAMGAQAGRISADNLHERLTIENAKDELGALALSFNNLLDRLDQSFEQQRRFVADASHELRTPVAILCGEADVTLSQPNRSPEEYRESLSILHAEAYRLKQIVEDLFTLARADAGQYRLSPTSFYLDELVAECARNMRTLASAKQITVRCDAQKEMPLEADETLLRRMILNLLDNAIKYTPQNGSVTITCGEQASQYSISVQDTGQGIPADAQPRIFERFFRVDKVRSRSESDGGGAGLGLSIGRWIAEAHGGCLELTRSDPNGSTFTALLPSSQTSPLIPRLSSSR